MAPSFTIVEQTPTAEAYARLIAAVGWRPRQRRAIEIALGNSLHSVCAVRDGESVGFGRVIGDGGLHLYLTDVVVHPNHQGQGIGTAIVSALTRWVQSFPFNNT